MIGLMAALPAYAVPVGNARTNFDAKSGVTYDLTTDTLAVDGTYNPRTATGAFASLSSILGSGSLKFSATVGTTIAGTSPQLLALSDGTQTYFFDVTSVETTALTQDQGTDSLALYVLGNVYGGSSGTGNTVASLVLSVTGTAGRASNVVAALQDPPETDPNPPQTVGNTNPLIPVPEPATFALLAAGLLGVGLARNRHSG